MQLDYLKVNEGGDKMNPTISVIMPNYNTPLEYLQHAVDSILKQSFNDFEFIIIDDCSTDDSYTYLCSIKDPRVRIIRNEINKGITATLNIGLKYARGEYIARMDSDDISMPLRFERQLKFMKENPDVVVCGTFAVEIGDGCNKRCRKLPSREKYRCSTIFGNIYGLIHPTAFFRASIIKENNITYNEEIPTAQDYDMWVKCSQYGEIANVEEMLFCYRIHKGQVSNAKRELQKKCTMYTMKSVLMNIIPNINEKQVEEHYQYCSSNNVNLQMRQWFDKIVQMNNSVKFFDCNELSKFIEQFLLEKVENEAKVVSSAKSIVNLWLRTKHLEHKIIIRTIFFRFLRRFYSNKKKGRWYLNRRLTFLKKNFGNGVLKIMNGVDFENYGNIIVSKGTLKFGAKNWKCDSRKSGLFVAQGGTLSVDNDFSIFSGSYICVNEGASLTIGGNGYINHNASIDCFSNVSIGEETIISKNVTIRDSDNHSINGCLEISAPISIGKKVWIGMNVTILKGVSIGDGAVIGANSVVTRDIPANCLAVGNPCRVIKNDITWN